MASGSGFWPRYRENLPRHLIALSRDLQTRVMASLREEHGHADLRPSLGPVLSLVWREGRPLGAVARELAISDQAVGQLATLAERAGYLTRRPNPRDRRSKLAVLTRRGRALVERGVQVILESESEYAALVGAGAYRRFTAALARLYLGLGLPVHADADITARASRSIGVLPLVAVRVQQQLMDATQARGHAGLKLSHGQVLPLIGLEGARIREIARLQGVSRQGISAITRDLEGLGYLRRHPDPEDGRGVVLRLSERGERLIADSVAALDDVERAFRAILGAERLAHLERVAAELYRARGQEEIQQLASRLRRRLGRADAARLAEALEPGAEAAPA